jgi:small basic protein (TIGR04137 family)
MSIDRSLRQKASLSRHRNVLSRAERILKLQEQERWTDSSSPLGLPKIAHRKAKAGKKKAAPKEEAAAAAAAEGQPAPAGAAKPAAAAGKPAASTSKPPAK